MSAAGFPSMLLRNAQHAVRVATASIGLGSKAFGYSYRPLDAPGADNSSSSTLPTSSPSPPSTPTRRGPRTLLQTRWGRLLLAGALVVSLLLVASVADVPATLRSAVAGGAARPDAPPPPQPALTVEAARAALTKDEDIAAVLRNPVEGLLDPAPIRALCDATRFQDGLVWHCELVNGGIGNVGNMWLNCVRFAIEAGATTIILPRIGARDEGDLGNLGDAAHSADLATLYDVDFFLRAWPDACPQMRAVLSDADVPNLPPLDQSPAMRANQVAPFARIKELIVDASGWRAAFDAWLASSVPAARTMSAATPLRVRQRLALSNWNREAHDPAFARAFARLFRFRTQARRLAAAVLWGMEQRTGTAMVADAVLFPALAKAADAGTDADADALVTSLGPGRLAPRGFLGVHLRVADDAAKAHWPGYDAQAPAYLGEAQARNLSLVYLATGSEAHRRQFHADAAARGIHVVTKEELLDDAERAELRSLAWDQQAIVDFDVLVHSSRFAGFVRSSFSWVVAIRRSILPEAGTPVTTRRAEPAPPAPIVEKYRDGLSVVVGRYDAMTIMGIWP